jgi:hypothetical protein
MAKPMLCRRTIICVLALLGCNGVTAATLCGTTERIIFSCQIKASPKIASVCASADLSEEAGYLQYRFGAPSRIEFVFPKRKRGSQDAFIWDHKYSALYGARDWLEFTSSNYRYSVHIIENRDTPDGELKVMSGVSVSRLPGDTIVRTFVCDGTADSSFGTLYKSAVPQRE